MSENLELVRSIYADWERGDMTRVDWADPGIEYVFADGPSPDRWAGSPEMAHGWRNFRSAWERFRAEATEYRELDSERVLVLARFSGKGKTSGLDIARMRSEGAHLFEVRGGKVTRIVNYLDRELALADLGLEA